MIYSGNAIKYGDNINTDLIIPGKYLHITDKKELATHSLEGVDPIFNQKCTDGDILVVGKNFGCGSSREQAAICIKHSGINVIISKSFARIFFRNAINQGIYLIESDKAVDFIDDGIRLSVDIERGVITNMDEKKEIVFTKLPIFLNEIIVKGGLIPYLKEIEE